MHRELLSVNDIQQLGFDWPRYEVVEKNCIIKDGMIDLAASIKRMEESRAFYQRLMDEAFAFKSKYGVDYSEFTDRHEDNTQNYNEYNQAISYLTEILQATEG